MERILVGLQSMTINIQQNTTTKDCCQVGRTRFLSLLLTSPRSLSFFSPSLLTYLSLSLSFSLSLFLSPSLYFSFSLSFSLFFLTIYLCLFIYLSFSLTIYLCLFNYPHLSHSPVLHPLPPSPSPPITLSLSPFQHENVQQQFMFTLFSTHTGLTRWRLMHLLCE